LVDFVEAPFFKLANDTGLIQLNVNSFPEYGFWYSLQFNFRYV